MMYRIKAATAFLVVILLLSCKNKNKEPGIEELNDVDEIAELTSAAQIESALENSESSAFSDYAKVQAFYETRKFQPLWNKREFREDLYRSIENIEEEGLFPEDYNEPVLKKYLSQLNEEASEENTFLELLLTDAFFKLTSHLNSGKLNPEEIYEIWGTTKNTLNTEDLLSWALSEDDIQAAIDSVKPTHPVYLGLKKSLSEYRKSGFENEAPIARIEKGKTLKPGEKDSRITTIAKRLTELGYLKNYSDSTYNDTLETAVRDFQKDFGIQVDGILGESTIENLNKTRKDRYHQILVNLERWRWYPKNLGEHYIIVNIPDFQLNIIKDKDTIKTHRTMVGTEARKTPVFSDQVSYIVYNPTWTVPPTIKEKDVIPAASKDISYLEKKNIQVYDPNGNSIEPGKIDWAKAKTYTYTQQAGVSNPLGRVKIIYPNEYLIYLHDTPSRDLFDENARARSSGCVRVQDALDLAAYLLDDQKKYDSAKIEEILASGKTTQIKLTKDVKVHHLYWTAYRKGNTTQFIDDVYRQDDKIWQLLKPGF